jgi:hypothetical protein
LNRSCQFQLTGLSPRETRHPPTIYTVRTIPKGWTQHIYHPCHIAHVRYCSANRADDLLSPGVRLHPDRNSSHHDAVSLSKNQTESPTIIYTIRTTTGSQHGDERKGAATLDKPTTTKNGRRNKTHEEKHRKKRRGLRDGLHSAIDLLVGLPEEGSRRSELDYDRLATASVM